MREQRKYLSRKEAHDYWRDPPHTNAPEKYAGRPSFKAVLRLVEKHIGKEARILELGCNVGTTLNGLHEAGWRNLSGIEINPAAVEMLRQLYPDMAAEAEIHQAPIEDALPGLGGFDLIYSKAVLCHIHPNSAGIFARMAEQTRWIITLEDEQTDNSGRHWPRNYRRIFAPFGFRQIEYVHEPTGLGAPYVGRVMVR